MTTTNTIPNNIAARIERAIEEQRQKAEQEDSERAEELAREQNRIGKAWSAFYVDATAQLDPVLAPYLVFADERAAPVGTVYVTISVPGIAPIKAKFVRQRDATPFTYVLSSTYLVPAIETRTNYDDGQIENVEWSFRYPTEYSLDEALVAARQKQAEYDERKAELERVDPARAERAQERELRQAEREQPQAEAGARAEQEREEEQLLLDMLKNVGECFAHKSVRQGHWIAGRDHVYARITDAKQFL